MPIAIDSIEFNEVDLTGSSYRVHVGKYIDLPYLPDPKVNLSRLVGANGAVSHGAYWHERYFVFECVMKAASTALLITQLDNLVTLLAVTEEKKLRLGALNDRYWMARPYKGFNPVLGGAGAAFTLSFVAPNPAATIG